MVSTLHLVALGHPCDPDGLHELLLALGRCSSRARSVAGAGTSAAPLAVRATRSVTEALTMLQSPGPCTGLILSHHFALPGPDSEDLMQILTERHPSLPVVCWGDFTRVNMASLKSCHVMLSWEKSAGTAPLVAVLRMLEAGDIRPGSRIKVSKTSSSGDKDDLLVIPVMGLGIPPFYWPSDSRMPDSVDVGDVHIPLGQGPGERRSSRASNGGAACRKQARGRLAFFFATESERTKMLLEEVRELREQERESRRGGGGGGGGGGPGQLPTRHRDGGGGGPGLDRVSTSSSACWNGLGACTSAAGQAAGGDGAMSRLMAAAFDDDTSSVTSLSSFLDVQRQSAGQAQAQGLWPQESEAGRPSLAGGSGSGAGLGFGTSWLPRPVTASNSRPLASQSARNLVARDPSGNLAPETPLPSARSCAVSGSGQLLAAGSDGGAGAGAQHVADGPQGQRLQQSMSLPSAREAPGAAAAAAGVGRCGSPQAAAQRLARELEALQIGFPLSPMVRELVAEVEQLRRLVQVKRALEQLGGLEEGEEGEGEGDADEQGRLSAERGATPALVKA